MRHLTEEEAQRFTEERCTFLEYSNIQEYIEDIVICLVYSSWHYSEEEAREKCVERMWIIEDGFMNRIPADDCCVDVGYCAG